MINRFLKAKHWQIFILMFGIPLVFQILMIGTLFFNVEANTNSNPAEMFTIFKFFPIIMILYTGIFFGWFWSVAFGLQKKLSEGLKFKTIRFKIFFFIPLIYITLLCLFISDLFYGILSNPIEPSGPLIGGMAVVIIPLHLLSMFGIFHSMYFVAKSMKTVELKRQVLYYWNLDLTTKD